MFKIDKSSVEYIDSNTSLVVVKHWMQQEIEIEEAQEQEAFPVQTGNPVHLQEDTQDAEEILQNAREEADLLIAEAARQSEEIKRAAWQEGYAQGVQEAIRSSEDKLQEEIVRLRQIVGDLEEWEKGVDAELEASIAQLSLDVAEKITNIHLEKNDIIFRALVKKAVQRLNAKEKFTIRLNKKEYEKYFSQGTRWLEEELQCAPCMAVSDPGIAPGGLTLDSDEGIIKAGVDAQLQMIARTMTRVAKQNAEAL